MNTLRHVGDVFFESRKQLAVTLFAIALLIVISMLHGCTVLQTAIGPEAKKITDYYCAQPLDARLLLREQVAQAIAPATLKLTCPGDPVTVPPSTTTGQTHYGNPRQFLPVPTGFTDHGCQESKIVDHQRDFITIADISDGRRQGCGDQSGSGRADGSRAARCNGDSDHSIT